MFSTKRKQNIAFSKIKYRPPTRLMYNTEFLEKSDEFVVKTLDVIFKLNIECLPESLFFKKYFCIHTYSSSFIKFSAVIQHYFPLSKYFEVLLNV